MLDGIVHMTDGALFAVGFCLTALVLTGAALLVLAADRDGRA